MQTNISQTVRVGRDGSITRGIDVPHDGANVACNAPVRRRSELLREDITVRCTRRVGHATPAGEKPHVPVDFRVQVMGPIRGKHQRFAPAGIPRGVDQSITLPHDCANHLPDVEDVARYDRI